MEFGPSPITPVRVREIALNFRGPGGELGTADPLDDTVFGKGVLGSRPKQSSEGNGGVAAEGLNVGQLLPVLRVDSVGSDEVTTDRLRGWSRRLASGHGGLRHWCTAHGGDHSQH